MISERISAMLANCANAGRVIPPTDLYNEGWMLRLALDWLGENRDIPHDLAFAAGSAWYSEALLPSAFLARYRGDKLAESWTHADGVIGHFSIGENGIGDLSVTEGVSQLLVTEAKMFSKLSSGVKNARYFDQAARNVACIAEVLGRANVDPLTVRSLGFFVVAPQSRIDESIFDRQMDLEGMREVVGRRVAEYGDDEKQSWYENTFIPVIDAATIRCISWEEILNLVSQSDSQFAVELADFYSRCLEFNRAAMNRIPD